MSRSIIPWLLRALLVTGIAVVIIGAAEAVVFPFGYGPVAVLVPFLAVGALVIAFGVLLPRIDALIARLTRRRQLTPYSALAEAARIQAGPVGRALPGLAELLAGSTGAHRAGVWLAVDDHLACEAEHPPTARHALRFPRLTPSLAVLLDHDDTDHVAPVLDGTTLRAALVITKPGAAITAHDKLLVREIARGAALLLRGEAQNAGLREQVHRARHHTAKERVARDRLARAREEERRRLADELTHAAGGGTAMVRNAVAAAQACLADQPTDWEAALAALARARTELEGMADSIRTTGRTIYPATLRESGLADALEELIVDLPRPVRWSGDLDGRLDGEIECGIYCAASAALRILAEQPSERELLVTLERAGGRVAVRIVDPDPSVTVAAVRERLEVEVTWLAALRGRLELNGGGIDDGRRAGPLTLDVWLPDRLEPAVAGHAGPEAWSA